MPPPTRKGIFLVLLAIFLVVAVAVIPDIISEEMRAWCLSTFGEGYQGYLLGFFVVGSVVLLFLTTDVGNWLRSGATPSKPDRFNIAPGAATRKQINLAKTAISEAEPEQALRHLSDLKTPDLEAEIDMLSGRLVEYKRNKRHGVDDSDDESRTFNRITRDIRDLVTTLEQELSTGTENYQTIKGYLKKRYTNRLEQKLANRQPVNLRRTPSIEGTSEERVAAFVPFNSVEISGEMVQSFHNARGRLLLIGAPGAGKSTLMLQLVLELLDTEPDALPVLLNLATWSKEYITLDAWLKKILAAEIGITGRYATEIVKQNQLILLLDGFDEIREEDRVSCLEAIGKYGEVGQRQFVISSRIQEYKAISKDAPVYWQMEVGPLTIEQMESDLNGFWENYNQPEPEARALLLAIRKDALLREAVQTPFYFNTLQILFSGGETLSGMQFISDTVAGRQKEIRERFVDYELKIHAQGRYPVERIKKWLSFFASRMNSRNIVIFELRDLQYDWNQWSPWKMDIVKMFHGLIYGLALALALFLLTGMAYGLAYGLASGLLAGVIVGLGVGLVTMLVIGLGIVPSIPLGAFIVFLLVRKLDLPLIGGLATGLGSIILGLRLGSKVRQGQILIETRDSVHWTAKNLFYSVRKNWFSVLASGLISGLVSSVVVALIVASVVGLIVIAGDIIKHSSTDILQITTPYQRFIASAKNLHFSIFQHLLLRYQLSHAGLLPLRLVDFLNEMSARHLMETDGATWRFRHRILQEYFAEQWKEPEENKK